LAEALGWPCETKQLAYNWLHNLPNFLLGRSRASLDRRRSSPLGPPWPDLVIDCGKRSVPVARWIRAKSGGKAALVHLGRPWTALRHFDLVVATPQYRVPPSPNVLQNLAPLHGLTPKRLREAAAIWAGRFADLPRPWIALIVGGDSPPYVLDPGAARRLGSDASALASACGGSLLVTTSARTRPPATQALESELRCPAHAHRWRPEPGANPYLAYLALADRFIVTGDSASMLAEACWTGKPVALFELPMRPGIAARTAEALERRLRRRGTPKGLARAFDRLIEAGIFMPPRDLAAYHRQLLARGLIHRLGEKPSAVRQPLRDMEAAISRIRSLFPATRTAG
jgi:hypothetical protein